MIDDFESLSISTALQNFKTGFSSICYIYILLILQLPTFKELNHYTSAYYSKQKLEKQRVLDLFLSSSAIFSCTELQKSEEESTYKVFLAH